MYMLFTSIGFRSMSAYIIAFQNDERRLAKSVQRLSQSLNQKSIPVKGNIPIFTVNDDVVAAVIAAVKALIVFFVVFFVADIDLKIVLSAYARIFGLNFKIKVVIGMISYFHPAIVGAYPYIPCIG